MKNSLAQTNTHTFTIPAQGETKRKFLFVHGLISSSIVWKNLIPHLDNSTSEYIFYDLYGRGKSRSPFITYSLSNYAEQLQEIITDHQLGPSDILIGLSWGCGIIAKFLSEYSYQPKEVIFLAPGGLKSPLVPHMLLLKLPFISNLVTKKAIEKIILNDFKNSFYRPSKFENFYELQREETNQNSSFIKTFLNSIKTNPIFFYDLYEKIFDRSIPLSIIWGENDKKSPYDLNKDFFETKNIPIQTIKECGHLLTWEQPEILAQLIMEKAHQS